MKNANLKIFTIFFALLYSTISSNAASFVMTTGAQPPYTNKNASGFLDLIAKSVFERLGHSVKVIAVPAKRAIIATAEGRFDGDMQRISGLEKSFPSLFPVREKISTYEFTGFSLNEMKLNDGLNSLAGRTVGYLRGWKFYEFNLPADTKTFIVDTPDNLFKLLKEKRIEVALYSRWSGQYWAKKTGINVKVISPPFSSRPMYMYLHRKNKGLIPSLERALRSMKTGGEYDQIFQNTLGNVGR